MRASEDTLANLHDAIATSLLFKIKSGEATAAEMAAAIKFLKDNNVTAVIEPGSTLEQMRSALPEFDDDGNVVQFSRA